MKPQIGIVTAETAVNLRATPGGEVIDTLAHGSKLVIDSKLRPFDKRSGGWLKVRYGKLQGFVYGNYVKVIAAPKPKPKPRPKPKAKKRKRVVILIVRRKRRYK